MDKQEQSHRLSRISTHWSTVLKAHGGETGRGEAKERVLRRYRGAVFRYLLGAVRNADVAEELAQEFAVRFLWGDFRSVDPERGRFRNYVKTVLINMVNDHVKSNVSQPRQLSAVDSEPSVKDEDPSTERTFEECLRHDLLDRTWTALLKAKSNYHDVLRLRVKYPEMDSRGLADQLESASGDHLTPDSVRKTIQRARRRFAELLLDEAATTLQCSSTEELRTELKELRLLSYCEGVLERRASQS